MDNKQLWDKFTKSGRVEDYLAFRRSMEASTDNPLFEDISSDSRGKQDSAKGD